MEMKFVLILTLLTCAESTFGQKDVCATLTPGNPISVTVEGIEGKKGEKGEKGDGGPKGDKGDPGTNCQCNLQDPNKPSAHIEGADKGNVNYPAYTVIKDWSVSAPHSHLAGGMKYHDGKLTVPIPGRYYIYTQLYYNNPGRVQVKVNNSPLTMIQAPTSGTGNGALYAGGVFNLKTGDVISLYTARSTSLYMSSTFHSYFGAFLI